MKKKVAFTDSRQVVMGDILIFWIAPATSWPALIGNNLLTLGKNRPG